jgi:23S rRNA U2552 (ribose-2'-O)-methylase RlmE/FtsJ
LPKTHLNLQYTDFNIFFNDIIDDKNIIYSNESLYNFLCQTKELISMNEEEWNNVKKYTNPYEYIHTNYENNKCICKLKPLSRAYFKFIEIIQEFNLLPSNIYTTIQSFHLAEGPGGFIEALLKSRNCSSDIYYGMTLIDKEDENIPGWKKSKWFLNNNKNVIIENGISGNGDLYIPENFKYIYETYASSMDIITADGGFDFSIDYNNQEIKAFRLIFTEVLYALILQKQGGSFTLKIFDLFTKASHQLLYLLSTFYNEVHIYKPYTSREGNSEKYIICKDFKGVITDEIYNHFYNILIQVNNKYKKIMTALYILF